MVSFRFIIFNIVPYLDMTEDCNGEESKNKKTQHKFGIQELKLKPYGCYILFCARLNNGHKSNRRSNCPFLICSSHATVSRIIHRIVVPFLMRLQTCQEISATRIAADKTEESSAKFRLRVAHIWGADGAAK